LDEIGTKPQETKAMIHPKTSAGLVSALSQKKEVLFRYSQTPPSLKSGQVAGSTQYGGTPTEGSVFWCSFSLFTTARVDAWELST
jgi:hypothetical protein